MWSHENGQVGTKDKELTGALLFNEQYSTTKYKICVIPTMVFYHYSHPVEGIDFTIAELEVFLKLEVFQGFSTDILVII